MGAVLILKELNLCANPEPVLHNNERLGVTNNHAHWGAWSNTHHLIFILVLLPITKQNRQVTPPDHQTIATCSSLSSILVFVTYIRTIPLAQSTMMKSTFFSFQSFIIFLLRQHLPKYAESVSCDDSRLLFSLIHCEDTPSIIAKSAANYSYSVLKQELHVFSLLWLQLELL